MCDSFLVVGRLRQDAYAIHEGEKQTPYHISLLVRFPGQGEPVDVPLKFALHGDARSEDARELISGLKKDRQLEIVAQVAVDGLKATLKATHVRIDRVDYTLEHETPIRRPPAKESEKEAQTAADGAKKSEMEATKAAENAKKSGMEATKAAENAKNAEMEATKAAKNAKKPKAKN